ncbi:MAG TPA: hypothetical protein VFI73_12855 [Candidatus Nitrosopolaris sp.]|nr:hypothetical protein [Candidatus Nitrosopolaris sp.]
MIKKIDISDNRTDKEPEAIISLLENGRSENQGFIVQRIELRQYIESSDPYLGIYSLITVLIKTDKGIVEMKYDEGYRGTEALKSAADFLSNYVGYASLICRTLIELQDYLSR